MMPNPSLLDTLQNHLWIIMQIYLSVLNCCSHQKWVQRSWRKFFKLWNLKMSVQWQLGIDSTTIGVLLLIGPRSFATNSYIITSASGLKMNPKWASNSQVSCGLVIDYIRRTEILSAATQELLAQIFCLPAEEITDSEQWKGRVEFIAISLAGIGLIGLLKLGHLTSPIHYLKL